MKRFFPLAGCSIALLGCFVTGMNTRAGEPHEYATLAGKLAQTFPDARTGSRSYLSSKGFIFDPSLRRRTQGNEIATSNLDQRPDTGLETR